jgi:flagellar protein FliO/FliZ
VAAALFFVLMVILLLAWLSKRLGGPYVGKNHVLMIKAALPLSAKEKLMIVQIGEEQVVIGVAPGFVGHIKTLDVPLVTNDSAMPINLSKASFSQTLRSILTRNIATHAEKNV